MRLVHLVLVVPYLSELEPRNLAQKMFLNRVVITEPVPGACEKRSKLYTAHSQKCS